MKISQLLALFFIVFALFWLKNHRDESQIKPSGNILKVGLIAPLSGATMSKGITAFKGMEIAQQFMPYLANGDAIEWVTIDDQGIPEQSVEALKTLSGNKEIAAIVILSGSDSVLAVSKIANQYNTPILVLIASHPDITKYSHLVNQFNFDDSFQASVAAFYARDELLIDSVAILTESDNAHFAFLGAGFARQFIKTEGVITDSYNINADTQDYLQILRSIQGKNPELLYLPVSLEHLYQIKSALLTLDWDPQLMVSDGIFANIKEQKKHSLSMMEGMLAIDAFSHDMEFMPLGDQLLAHIHSTGVNTQEIDTNSALGMEGFVFLVSTINQCLELKNKRLCINNSIRNTVKFGGIKGLITFDKTGKAHRSLSVNKINNGLTEFIVQVY